MEKNKLKTPKKGAGTRLRDLSIKRRSEIKPSKDFLEIFERPAEPAKKEKKSAKPSKDVEI